MALVVNAEDGPEDTIRPRLQALFADLERVFVPQREGDADWLSLPGHTAALDALLMFSISRPIRRIGSPMT